MLGRMVSNPGNTSLKSEPNKPEAGEILPSLYLSLGANKMNKVNNQVWYQVGSQVWYQVGCQVRDQVRGQVRDQVWDQVEAQVRGQVSGDIRNH